MNVHEVLLYKYVTVILINYVYNVKVHNLQVLIFLSFALWLLALVLCCLWPELNPKGPQGRPQAKAKMFLQAWKPPPKGILRDFKEFEGNYTEGF